MLTHLKNRHLLIKITNYSHHLKIIRKYSSSPRIKVEDKNTVYSILNPFIDFHDRLKNSKLQDSIDKRELKVNLNQICALWNEYKTIEKTKHDLEKSKIEIAEKIKSYSDPAQFAKEIAGLKTIGKVIREDIRNTSNTLSDFEQNLLPKILSLPNDLRDDLFPSEVESYFTPKTSDVHHLDIGKKLGIIDYLNPTAYFLKRDAANFELDVTSYFFNSFYENGFVPVSNPDFSRSLIIEGASVNPDSLFKLAKDKRSDDLFLHGSSSLYPFCSYHTKQISEDIPIKYVAQGRCYLPYTSDDGLYSVWQNNAVQVFVASSETNILEEFNNIVQLVSQIYKKIGLHFRILRIQPSELELLEALRLSFQVHSPFKNDFVEVGNLSFYSDYISKRLRMYYRDNESLSFLHLFSGTIMKIPPLLAAYIECNNNCKFCS